MLTQIHHQWAKMLFDPNPRQCACQAACSPLWLLDVICAHVDIYAVCVQHHFRASFGADSLVAAASRSAWNTEGLTSLHLTHIDKTGQTTEGVSTSARHTLERALDDMSSHKELLFGKYAILASGHRRRGAQGLVQFVLDASGEGSQYAVKFFQAAHVFACEAEMYANPKLRKMMTATREIGNNMDQQHVGPGGYVFPPFIVFERGESLNEWTMRMRAITSQGSVDIVHAYLALSNIAQRLQELHSAGYVHRDLKPSNVLWLSRIFAWTLIDFGSAAEIGTLRHHYTLPSTVSSCIIHWSSEGCDSKLTCARPDV
jgi:Protein kinase domain